MLKINRLICPRVSFLSIKVTVTALVRKSKHRQTRKNLNRESLRFKYWGGVYRIHSVNPHERLVHAGRVCPVAPKVAPWVCLLLKLRQSVFMAHLQLNRTTVLNYSTGAVAHQAVQFVAILDFIAHKSYALARARADCSETCLYHPGLN